MNVGITAFQNKGLVVIMLLKHTFPDEKGCGEGEDTVVKDENTAVVVGDKGEELRVFGLHVKDVALDTQGHREADLSDQHDRQLVHGLLHHDPYGGVHTSCGA